MSLSAQVKFLRVVQEREFHRLGGTKEIKADVRVIAATNRDLGAAMDCGAFREALLPLKVFEIRIPALRERPEDICRSPPLFSTISDVRFGARQPA